MMIKLNKFLKSVLIVFIFLVFFPRSTEAVEITSEYGWRWHPIYNEWRFHTGIDLGYEYGTLIASVIPGVVVYSDWYDGYGYTVIIEHDNDRYTLYGHCSQLYVQPGQYVDETTTIASTGNSGNSTGPHLHLSYWINGEYVDPMVILN